jgi:hypothetical protein
LRRPQFLSSFEGERLPVGAAKWQLLSSIIKATETLVLASVLKVIGLSISRYRGGHRREKIRALTDGSRIASPWGIRRLQPAHIGVGVSEKLSHTTTCKILGEAAKLLQEVPSLVTVLADSGVKNANDAVDQFLFDGALRRVLVQVEIVESDSAVEAWWRVPKNQWLYFSSRNTEASVRKPAVF